MSVDDASIATRHSHPIGSLGERFNDQILIPVSPFSHPRVRVDDRGNILDDVLFLPSFVMNGHSKRRQRLESVSDIDFRATCNTYVKSREGKSDKPFHEAQDQVPRRWHPKSIGTLVDRVHNNVDWPLIGGRERLLQVLYQDVISRLVCAVVMSLVCAVEYITAMIGAGRKLRKKGKEQVPTILLVSIPEVEVVVCHESQSGIAQSHDILDDCRATRSLRLSETKT